MWAASGFAFSANIDFFRPLKLGQRVPCSSQIVDGIETASLNVIRETSVR